MGLEPMISRTTIWRANQLHHTHHTEPGGIRTLDLRLRRPLLYPAELQTHTKANNGVWLSLARAPGLGPGGRRFESCHPDFAGVVQW